MADAFCPGCGAPQDPTNAFCPKCGGRLDDVAPAAPPAPSAGDAGNGAESANALPEDLYAQLQAAEAQHAREQKRRNSIGCLVMSIVFVAFVALLVSRVGCEPPPDSGDAAQSPAATT